MGVSGKRMEKVEKNAFCDKRVNFDGKRKAWPLWCRRACVGAAAGAVGGASAAVDPLSPHPLPLRHTQGHKHVAAFPAAPALSDAHRRLMRTPHEAA